MAIKGRVTQVIPHDVVEGASPRFSVTVSVPTESIGPIVFDVTVDAPDLTQAKEAVRRKLYSLGTELAWTFDYPSGLV